MVFLEMDVGDCMVGCPPPGTPSHCTKVRCQRDGLLSQSTLVRREGEDDGGTLLCVEE